MFGFTYKNHSTVTGLLENSKISFSGIFVMQSSILSTLLSSLHVFIPKKITKFTSFDVTLRAKMFITVVKLILTGGKNDKILTTVVVWACYA